MKLDPKVVLAIGAHTDDLELGCGATLARLRREGAQIHVMALSRAEASLPAGSPKDLLEQEFQRSMAILGPESLHVSGIPVRYFPEHRQPILEELVARRRELKPDLVITHCSTDTHQDHQVVHAEAVRAFRGASIIGFEIPWNMQQSRLDLHMGVTEADVEQKIAQMACYESQVTLGRPYAAPDFVRAMARFRGVQSKQPLAEAFETVYLNLGA